MDFTNAALNAASAGSVIGLVQWVKTVTNSPRLALGLAPVFGITLAVLQGEATHHAIAGQVLLGIGLGLAAVGTHATGKVMIEQTRKQPVAATEPVPTTWGESDSTPVAR